MRYEEVVSRVEALENKMDTHIHDGIAVWQGLEGVKTDITWIKRALWVLVTLGISFNGLLVKYVLSHVFTGGVNG